MSSDDWHRLDSDVFDSDAVDISILQFDLPDGDRWFAIVSPYPGFGLGLLFDGSLTCCDMGAVAYPFPCPWHDGQRPPRSAAYSSLKEARNAARRMKVI